MGHAISPTAFSQQIAFNLIPHIDDFQEMAIPRRNELVWEIKKY